MFLYLVFPLVVTTSYAFPVPEITPFHTVLAHPSRMAWAAVTPSITTRFPSRPRAESYDVAETTDELTGTEETTDADGNVGTSTGVSQDLLSAISAPTTTSVTFIAELFTTGTPTSTEVPSVSSDASLEPSFVPVLGTRPPTTQLNHSHPTVIPILVGSAVGALALISATILVVCCCRRRSGNDTSSRWFNSNEKEGIVVSIRVPPPTVPLKGILIQNPTSFPPSPTEFSPHPNRVSLTSSQLSVIINNLPKSYDSGLESGVLDEVRQGSPIRATRIGPSPSDLFAGLFGGTQRFSSVSIASQALRSPPQSPPRNVAPVSHRDDDSPLPVTSDAFVHPHTPAFPHSAAASPSLGFMNGPRGHGLVLTGDTMVPSFAQWHYQRTTARGRDGSIAF